MTGTFTQLRAAAIDGRTHSVYYRQEQLERLCDVLIKNFERIQTAIAADSSYSPAEIAVEYSLAISAVKRDYALLQPAEAHESEYLIASGKDAPSNRTPFGIVYIEPTKHSFFYSSVVPLSAALAAGNCVILLLENTLRETSALLRQFLSEALDPDTFAVTTTKINDRDLLDQALTVQQTSDEQWPRVNQLASAENLRTIGVIDRTADVGLAARELVAARSSFGGSSPYAPDVVLVNEFVKQSFLDAVMKTIAAVQDNTATNGDLEASKPRSASAMDDKLKALKATGSRLNVVSNDSRLAVVDMLDRNETEIEGKTGAAVLLIHAISSLDDAIHLVSRTNKTGPCLAAYHFGRPDAAKYLAQFIDARVSFVNHVPRNLLVGPAYPLSCESPLDLDTRYPPHLFSTPRPAYIVQRPEDSLLADALASPSNSVAQRLQQEAVKPLVQMKRHPGGGVGFFEQGFLMNASLILVTIISVSGASVWGVLKYRYR